MQEPTRFGTIIIAVLIIFIIFTNILKDYSINDFRKKQAYKNKSKSNFSNKVEVFTNTKVKFSKRIEIELLIKQAGYNYKYYQYFIMVILSSILTCFLSYLFIRNEFLAVEMIFIGITIPKQILTYLRNKRISALEKQLSPFFQMIIKRYLSTRDFENALKLTREEFVGMEPLYTELNRTVAEIDSKIPVTQALDNLAERSMNKYLVRFSDYYKIASSIGTQEVRRDLLGQAQIQYEEDKKLKDTLNTSISEPVRDSQIMILTIPVFALFAAVMMDGWVDFMANTIIGKLVIAAIFGLMMGCLWFINNKIGAPLK